MIDVYTDDPRLQKEYSLIGCAFICFDAVKQQAAVLQPEDFADESCRKIWAALKKSETREVLIENLAKAGVPSALFASCTEAAFAIESALSWLVDGIQTQANARQTRDAVRTILAEAEDADLLQSLERALTQAKQRMAPSGTDLPRLQAETFLASLLSQEEGERIPSGIPQLDKLTGGFRPGSISVVAALPSVGKTALALNFAAAAVQQGQRVSFFSLEMTDQQLLERYISATAGIPYSLLNEHKLGGEMLRRANVAVNDFAKSERLLLRDDLLYVEQQGNALIRSHPGLVVVDYLQKVRTKERMLSGAERLEYLVDEYKRLAMAYDCHICLLSQHSREASRERTSLFTLKGSSGIEQGGDYILLLDRPCLGNPAMPEVEAHLRLAKHKYGQVGEIALWFDGEYQRFRQLRPGELYPLPADKRTAKPF